MMQKMVERMYPELDLTEKFASRKRKLDELHEGLGEELYQAKLIQLKDEYMKASAFYGFLDLMLYCETQVK
jgi:hypothetical protein